MEICASEEKLVQEETGIRRGRVYQVDKNKIVFLFPK